MAHELGAIMGALIGDAAGVTLEFINKPITREMADVAMSMPGGGALNVLVSSRII